MEYIEGQQFEKVSSLHLAEYENCQFFKSDFSKASFSKFKFIDCTFTDCNLSGTNISQTALQNVKFIDSKMLGLHFELTNPFLLEMHFKNCLLNFASFVKLKLKNTKFESCQLRDIDFTDTDLTASLFDNCDLQNAVFDHTILQHADFRTAFNFHIDPTQNKIKKAKFSINGTPGLLSKFDIDITF